MAKKKGSKKGKKGKKNQATAAGKEEPKKEAPKKEEPKKDEPKKDEPKKDEPKKEAPKSGKKAGGATEGKQSDGLTEEEKSRKIEKNRGAVDHLVTMVSSIPPDVISQATRQDLIQIHSILSGIVKRYQPKDGEKNKSGRGGAGKNSDGKNGDGKGGNGKTDGGQSAAAFKLDGVKPAFADIFEVGQPDEKT